MEKNRRESKRDRIERKQREHQEQHNKKCDDNYRRNLDKYEKNGGGFVPWG